MKLNLLCLVNCVVAVVWEPSLCGLDVEFKDVMKYLVGVLCQEEWRFLRWGLACSTASGSVPVLMVE